MGSNGGLTSRTSSSLSSHHQHISETNYMSDDNPDEHLAPPHQQDTDQEIKLDPENNAESTTAAIIALTKQDFLVSFLVDARGGSMKGCRHSGVKVIIPPKTAPQPMRITCRYIRENALLHPPKLNEGEGLACRILQVGPRGSKFLGPVLIEVPHVASLRHGDREVVVLRCDSASKGTWTEHIQAKLDDKTLKDFIEESSSSLTSTATSTSNSSPVPGQMATKGCKEEAGGSRSASRLNHHQSPFHRGTSPQQLPPLVGEILEMPRNVVHIVTKDFPQYFAIISRPRQDQAVIGPEGAILTSLRIPKAQVYHKAKSLVKPVNVGLSVLPIEDEMVEEIMVQGGAVSPMITIEPRRRKFHKAITVTMPLPERMSSQYLRRKQENGAKSPIKKDPAKMPIGANDVTVNPNMKAPSSSTVGVLPPSPKEVDRNSEIEMSLRLMCSMSGNHCKAFWEDVTDNTPMTVLVQSKSPPPPPQLPEAAVERDPSSAVDLRRSNLPPISPIEDRSPGSVQFTSLVSASFWLVHCPNWMSSDVVSLVDQLYKNAVKVPYFCRIHIYARRRLPPPAAYQLPASSGNGECPSPTPSLASNISAVSKALNNPAHLRVLCLTEPARAIHPLELQEDFVEIARSDYVEVRDGSEIEVHFGGNLYKHVRRTGDESDITPADEFELGGTRKLIFHPFSDNRQSFAVKRRNENNPYGKGSIAFQTTGDTTLFEAKIDLSKFMQ